MSAYAQRPWLAQYQAGVPADITPEFPNALAMFKASVAANAQRPLIHYFERKLGVSYREDRPFEGTLVKDGRREARRAVYFSRNLGVPGNQADPRRFEERAEELGLLKRARVGRGFVLGMRARDFGPLIEAELKADPAFLTLAGRENRKEARA